MAFNLAGSRGSTIADALQASRLAREKAESTMNTTIAGQVNKTPSSTVSPPDDKEFAMATNDDKNAPYFREWSRRFQAGRDFLSGPPTP